jgi:aldehyde dehydrogenase (NAD+)
MNSNNKWSASSDGKTFDTKNPFNDQNLLSFAHATQEDVDRAVKAARKAFQTTWGNNIHATERAACESILFAIYIADG